MDTKECRRNGQPSKQKEWKKEWTAIEKERNGRKGMEGKEWKGMGKGMDSHNSDQRKHT